MTAGPLEPTDEALLSRFAEGDVRAFERLLERYRRPVYNFVLRMVRERTAAEDMVQEVFVRVVSRAEEFRGQSRFSTWMYTIARNLCVDHARKMAFRRHASLDASTSSGNGDDGRSLLDKIPGPSRGADRETIGRQLREALVLAVSTLPDDQREVFLLRQVQGLPFNEIASIVGVPENTAKSRMRYALERLQDALADYHDYVATLNDVPSS